MTRLEFEKMYQIHFQYVYLYLIKLCKDEHLAEELTSETFFKAMKGIEKFQEKCDIKTWLATIAKNTYFSHQKRNKSLLGLDYASEVIDQEADIEKQILKVESSMEIHKILHLLEEPYKEVFTLRILGELSFKQIAEICGKSENWACVTYHRAKSKITSKMEEEDENYL